MNSKYEQVSVVLIVALVVGFMVLLMVDLLSSPTIVSAGPNPTATAPMPGDPPPSQDWLDNRATLDAPKPAPYPAPSTPTPPAAYPEQEQEIREVSGGFLAGLWAWIWDLNSN